MPVFLVLLNDYPEVLTMTNERFTEILEYLKIVVEWTGFNLRYWDKYDLYIMMNTTF